MGLPDINDHPELHRMGYYVLSYCAMSTLLSSPDEVDPERIEVRSVLFPPHITS